MSDPRVENNLSLVFNIFLHTTIWASVVITIFGGVDCILFLTIEDSGNLNIFKVIEPIFQGFPSVIFN